MGPSICLPLVVQSCSQLSDLILKRCDMGQSICDDALAGGKEIRIRVRAVPLCGQEWTSWIGMVSGQRRVCASARYASTRLVTDEIPTTARYWSVLNFARGTRQDRLASLKIVAEDPCRLRIPWR